MISYDKAYELARELKSSEEYRVYTQAKAKAFENEMNKNLYKEMKNISYAINAAYLAGQQPDGELSEKYQKLMGVLSLNSDVMAFMQAEYRINQMMTDVFKILSEAVDLRLDFMAE
ncbi:MAG: YlbF family regulator [Clostridiales bacterium]|nr:YlbF family regulator [Clostridiales bacterium]